MKHSKRQTKENEKGFTLAEMMAVIVISSMTVSFIFFLFIDQSRLAQTQAQIGDLQTSLQFSVASIERDLKRAGFMSIVSNADKRLCQTYSGQEFNALRFTNADPVFASALKKTTNVNKNIKPDTLELFGNYTTTTDFSAYIDPSDSTKMIVDFAGTSINNQSSFERSFYSPNQLVMVKGQTGRLHIVQIKTTGAVSTVYNQGTNRAILSIQSGLKLQNNTRCGIAIRFRVTPLHKIRYRIKNTNTDGVWELIKEVLDPGTCTSSGQCNGGKAWKAMGTSDPHPPLVIAPHAVDLQFWFSSWNSLTKKTEHMDPRCKSNQVSSCNNQTGVAAIHDDKVSHWPADSSMVRSVFFRVTVRSEDEDPSLQFVKRPSAVSTIVNYDVNPKKNGSARTRSIVKNVMIPNMLAR